MYRQMRQPESDHTLLNAFATRQCQRAFAELVQRHGAMVFSAALRQVRRRDLAEDVTQAVFLVLAQRAGSISSGIPLAAWLHKTCRYTALNALKMERRRARYEQQAAQMAQQQTQPAGTPSTAGWSALWPILDEGIERLSDADRSAIVLRFLEQRPLADVGRQMGVSEDAAGMRVSRALERLRAYFHRRGIGLSTANLGVVLGAQLPSQMSARLADIVSTAPATPPGAAIAAGPSTLALELAQQMDSTLAWQSARAGLLTVATAAAVFALLCGATSWWVTPPRPAAYAPPMEFADASSMPRTIWVASSPMALP